MFVDKVMAYSNEEPEMFAKKAKVFESGRPFQHSLMIIAKACLCIYQS